LARVDDLTREVTALRDELARMREGTARAPVTTALPDGASPRAEDDFAEVHREGILEVIEQDRAARELGLSAMQQKALADVYTLERQKLAELRATLVTDAYSEMPVNVREQFATLRQWRTDELTTRFGSDLAQKISELDADRWGRGRRGGGDAGTPR
jgi:hypothetical protein